MTSLKPTILFIHGSWHSPAHFAPIISLLSKAGFPTSCPRQPSVGHVPPLPFSTDVECIQNELVRLIEKQEQEVLVVAHSYGGVISSQAVEARLARRSREEDGRAGGVVGILYMCAFLLEIGQSLAGAFGGSLPPYVAVDDDDMITMLNPEHYFYNDLPSSEQQHWIAELQRSPRESNHTPISYAAYLHHPVTYLYCENDAGLPLQVQKAMVEKVKDQGVGVVEETCSAGHSPYLSMPERVLEIIQDTVKRTTVA